MLHHTIAALAILASPLPAMAHAILVESSPAAGSSVAPGPQHLVLRFNSKVDGTRSAIELRNGDAKPQTVKLAPGPAADTLVADPVLAAGQWVLRWQVLAVDGHITRGDIPLTVKAP